MEFTVRAVLWAVHKDEHRQPWNASRLVNHIFGALDNAYNYFIRGVPPANLSKTTDDV